MDNTETPSAGLALDIRLLDTLDDGTRVEKWLVTDGKGDSTWRERREATDALAMCWDDFSRARLQPFLQTDVAPTIEGDNEASLLKNAMRLAVAGFDQRDFSAEDWDEVRTMLKPRLVGQRWRVGACKNRLRPV
jgi:hypothetical protein